MRPYVFILCVYLIYTFLAVEILPALKILERQISLFLIPLVVFSVNFTRKRFIIFFYTYFFSMVLISLFSFGLIIWFLNEQSEWIHTMNLINGNNTYVQFKYTHLMGAHPTYWSYLLIIANIILVCKGSIGSKIKKPIIILIWFIFNLNILYLAARTPILINLAFHIVFVMIYFKTQKHSLLKLSFIVSLFVALFFIAINTPLLKFKVASIFKDERMFLWPVAIEKIKNNYFLMGEGLGQGFYTLRSFIVSNGDPRINYNGFDLHNQYLTQYIDMGILGIISLMYLIIFPIIQTRGKLNLDSLAITGFSFMFFVGFFTESSLYLIKGIIIFAVFSSILSRSYVENTVHLKKTVGNT